MRGVVPTLGRLPDWLRGLERDGMVRREVHPTIPPRVDYSLTPMGRALLDAVNTLLAWAERHLPQIDAARAGYDRRSGRRRVTDPGTTGTGRSQ
jgi:DNA-binding HxlR family transcriptional regulator